jgi:hypothetical protein
MPGLPILFTSGFSENAISAVAQLALFAEALREILDS